MWAWLIKNGDTKSRGTVSFIKVTDISTKLLSSRYPDQFLLVLSWSIPACVIRINSCLWYPDQILLVLYPDQFTCVISGSIPACVISGSISTCVISRSIPACDIQVNSWMLQYFYHLNCSCRQDRCDPLPAMSVYKNGRTYTED